jgi:hypothetical protein
MPSTDSIVSMSKSVDVEMLDVEDGGVSLDLASLSLHETTKQNDSGTSSSPQSGSPSSDKDTSPESISVSWGTSGFPDAPDQDWVKIKTIPNEAFIEVLLKRFDHYDKKDCRVTKRSSGSFHLCAFIEVAGQVQRTYIIRVPANGTADFWDKHKARTHRSETTTMRYIKQKAMHVPLPHVYASDDTLNNAIGAPYILMDALKGEPAYKLWKPDGSAFCTSPSPELEHKRQHFLHSLANVMAELGKLHFPRMGMLYSEDPFSYPLTAVIFNPDNTDNLTAGFSTCKERWNRSLSDKNLWSSTHPNGVEKDMDTLALQSGLHSLLTTIASSSPFSRSVAHDEAAESFVLRHTDLDLQNILVDNEGNVTGIIDWDNCSIVPRCVGPAALPLWLQEDYNIDYDILDAEHLPEELEHYRRSYANYMLEATMARDSDGAFEDGDWKYTAKSGVYDIAYWLLRCGPRSNMELVKRLFVLSEGLRLFDCEDFLESVGYGGGRGGRATGKVGRRAEGLLRREIIKLLAVE